MDIDKEYERLTRKAAKWERAEARQLEHERFVTRHNLACFNCGSRMNPWAATGTKNSRHWALCIRCQRDKWRAR